MKAVDGIKRCSSCKCEKQAGEFYRQKGTSDGFQTCCKACSKLRVKAWLSANPEKRSVLTRRDMLKRKYGLSIEQYEEMSTNAKGVCEICGGNEPNTGDRLSVDHCHATGKIRGLLCSNCNKALGMLMDDPELAIKAALYLESRRATA